MSIYYQDDHVTLHHGDSLEILPTLDVQADALLTDPPYFKVKNEDWDRQWAKPDEFLRWIGSFLDAAKPLLAPHASVWVFASPQLATDIEITVRDRFRVLNNIRWTKQAGWHQKASLDTIRSFLTPWEGIIFAEQYSEAMRGKQLDEAKSVWSAIGGKLRSAREEAALTREEVAASFTVGHKNIAGAKARVSAWEIGNERITARAFAAITQSCDVPWASYEVLSAEYDEADANRKAELDRTRRPFTPTTRALANDIWDFAPVRPYPGKHPCEKPAPLLRHMIETSTRPGALILDPFAGSGSTLEVAAATGRHAIGIEKSEEYCEKIAHRLSTRTEQLALI